MNKKTLFGVSLLVVVVALGAYLLGARKSLAPTVPPVVAPASIPDLIVVDQPLPQSAVSSPLSISGRARGTWYFEASAPVELLDAAGTTVGHGIVTAQGDWMTAEFVPFTAQITFTKPATKTGTLILKNDNPSGEPSRDKRLEIPVVF